MYHLRILTPEEIIFDDDIISLIVPGEEGYLGILQNHCPLITLLKAGIITLTTKDHKRFHYKIDEGFFEVKENNAVLLTMRFEETAVVESNVAI